MADAPNRVKEVFLQALELNSDERGAFLRQALGSDRDLLQQVEAMLQAHAVQDSFLERPTAELEDTLDAHGISGPVSVLEQASNSRIGPYKLLEGRRSRPLAQRAG